jgi:hypothetical protein
MVLDTTPPERRGRPRRRPGRLFAGIAALAVTVGTPALATVAAGPAGASTTRAAATNRLVQVAARPSIPAGAHALGAVPSGRVITGDVGLVPGDAAGLSAYAAGVGDATSPLYHHYLSLPAFRARFAPSAATIGALEATLRHGGLTVRSVSADGLLVSFSGTAARTAATFHTDLGGYRLRDGRAVYANTTAARLPAAVAGHVQVVVGLDDLVVPQAVPVERATHPHGLRAAPRVVTTSRGPNACAAATADADTFGGLTDSQIAQSYGLTPLFRNGNLGQGTTVDILDLYSYADSDLKTFDNCFYGANGPSVYANLSSVDVDGGAQLPDFDGGTGETTLDAEDVQAVAPQAKTVVYEAPPTNFGFLDDIAAMTDSPAAIESISYGSCEQEEQATLPGYIQIENDLFEQAAAEGKTVLSSSADNGSDTCSADSGEPVAPILSPSDPSSQPYVTSVGGTAILAATDPPLEEVWNDGAAGGAGGGGISAIWSQPAWQREATVPGIDDPDVINAAEVVSGGDFCLTSGTKSPCRELPDVSADASPNTGGITIYLGGFWTVIGGTSSSSPLWAAMLADIDSTRSPVASPKTCAAATGGVGFVSPSLYAIASVPAEYAASFNDVTIGNNDNFGVADGLYPATTGYDMATGLGTPQVTSADGGRGLSYYLCSLPAGAPTVTALSPTAVTTAGGGTLTVTGQGFETGGSSVVAGVTIGSYQVPAADVTVTSPTELVVSPVPGSAVQKGAGGDGDGSGSYDVTVTVTGGRTTATGPDAVLVYFHAGAATSTLPVTAGVSPAAGPETPISGHPTEVTVYGSGFTTQPVTGVTFGGVAATSFTVLDDNRLVAFPPAYSTAPACLAADVPSTGVCQTQVVVSNAAGPSATVTIAPEYAGPVADEKPPTGLVQAATEFDYEPAPHLDSVSFGSNNPPEASQAGGTVVTITGTGLGVLGLEWVDVGTPAQGTSYDSTFLDVSSTKLVVELPPEAVSTDLLTEPVSVQTFGSPNLAAQSGSVAPSNEIDVTYAGTPTVTSSSTGKTYQAGPTSGGTTLTVKGAGFTDVLAVEFTDEVYGFTATAYPGLIAPTSESSTSLVLKTPAALTGVYSVGVCTVSGCSLPEGPDDVFTYYLPGAPAVTSVTPTSGPAGTKVVISGNNLGYVQSVTFGSTKATTFANVRQFFESGDTSEVTATVPKGTVGTKVEIRIATLESVANGAPPSPGSTKVTFTYKAATKKA